eukprot:TRINITY_DN10247_c0_g1_i1.p1 TRINITY_DN10247_c0_g1~~TRINITY_DN10247_c0_g1_i1.p1  ORF type:complete len:598 (+),score=133.03 TRINITY_DN10247_c0_g1_i1:89-1795(+)
METQASESILSSSFAFKAENKENPQSLLSDPNPWSSKTPEKPICLPRRAKNRGVAFSLKEVRSFAQGLQKNQRGSSHLKDLQKAEDPIDAASILDSVPKSAKAKAHTKLPEKYVMLVEFFNCLVSSIRLLRLKGLRSTFTNISPQIETLTDRRFSYGHLAQLKYVLSEAISIEKILIRDERTLCMKPDLQVVLQFDAFEISGKQKPKPESGYSILKKMFHARLLDFFKTHAEGEEIPAEILPEPFNETKLNAFPGITDASLQRPSHMSQSFQRRFSQKIMPESEETKLHPSTSPLKPIAPAITTQQPPHVSAFESPIKCVSKPPTSKRSFTFCSTQFKLPQSSPLASREEERKPTKSEDHTPKELDGIEGTPLKRVFTPSKPLITTPKLRTPKRYRPNPDDDSTSPNKSVSRPLKFNTPVKKKKARAEQDEDAMSSVDAAIIKLLPDTLLQSVRDKERKAMEDHDAGVIEAKRRQQMIGCLPKLFDMIHLIFQSMKRSVMTKQELMYKIIANHCDIVDKEEIEEQLKLLQELVPDWISGKMSSSGDFLFCVNTTRSPTSIHARLAVAE